MGWHVRPALLRAMGTRLFIQSAMPKSASSQLKAVLEQAMRPSGKFVHPKITFGFGHNFYDPRRVPFLPGPGRILRFYGHTPLTEYNRRMMEAIDPRFVALLTVRPLADIVISHADHIDKHRTGPVDIRIRDSVEGFRYYDALDEAGKFEFLIDFVMPWYVILVASWLNFEHQGRLMIIKFDEVTNDIDNVLERIGEFAGKNDMPASFSGEFDKDMRVNFNKGVNGRGSEMLTDRHRERLRNIAAILKKYPGHEEMYEYMVGSGA